MIKKKIRYLKANWQPIALGVVGVWIFSILKRNNTLGTVINNSKAYIKKGVEENSAKGSTSN